MSRKFRQAHAARRLGRADAITRLRPGLAILCLAFIAINLRPGLVLIGPLLPSARAYFGLSHTVAALLVSIPDLLLGLMAVPAPWLAARFGRDRVIVAALVLLALATAGRAASPSTAALLVMTIGVGTGIAIAQALVGSFVKAEFRERAGLMIGVYATFLSVGSALAAGLTGPLIRWAGDDWRVGPACGACSGSPP